ncbi:MAG: PAP2 family protein [Chloroflexales bacterium]|nr:PAP2 family protein [Chloroflexales bacterium]
MSRQTDLTAEALRRGASPGRGYALARTISQILHPIMLSLMSVFIVGLLGVEPPRVGLLWALLCAFIQIVPGAIFFTIRLKQGAYTDDDVSVRSQRNELYLFGFITLAVGLLILWLLGAPAPILALVASATLLGLLAWVINLYWKISVHASTMGSTATLAALYSKPLGLALWLCALALGWARVRTRNHTLLQVAAGLTLAAACVVGTFMAFGLL